MTPNLKSKLLINAAIKLCFSQNIISTVISRGDENNGVIWLKILRKDNKSRLLGKYFDDKNKFAWKDVFDEHEKWQDDKVVNNRISREISYDPDLWVLEIETETYFNPFERIL